MQTRNENSIAQATNGMVKSAVGFIDSLNLGVIFGFHLQPLLLQFLMELGKYIFFPVSQAPKRAAANSPASLRKRANVCPGIRVNNCCHARVR